ncbi:MAG TPA: nitrogen regulation protein NR(II) [Gammaproteobacteria bacterium]|nr:nitrogen regulation protein NR(II) [Gammaproteobacteria bacterium]
MTPTNPTAHLAPAVLDSLTTATVLLDRELAVVYLNPSAESLFGASLAHRAGRPVGILVPGADELCAQLRQVLDSGDPYTVREFDLPLPGGRQVTADIAITPMREAGEAALLLEIVPLDRRLRITREEALLAQQQVSRTVLRGLAHEIKNPLGGLRGAAQLLERELEDPDLREYTRVVIAEADRLRNLVDSLLGPARPPRRRPVNIHRVLEHVRMLVEAETHPGIVLETDYDPSIPRLRGDPEQLIQAVLNIVRNAVEAVQARAAAAADGVIRLRTRTARQRTLGHRRHRLVARIEVIDNGPGIPEEQRDTIFYPLVTGRPDGTGLGLSIAQDLVGRHGGLIECESRPGQTCFTIFLPLSAADGEVGHG